MESARFSESDAAYRLLQQDIRRASTTCSSVRSSPALDVRPFWSRSPSAFYPRFPHSSFRRGTACDSSSPSGWAGSEPRQPRRHSPLGAASTPTG